MAAPSVRAPCGCNPRLAPRVSASRLGSSAARPSQPCFLKQLLPAARRQWRECSVSAAGSRANRSSLTDPPYGDDDSDDDDSDEDIDDRSEPPAVPITRACCAPCCRRVHVWCRLYQHSGSSVCSWVAARTVSDRQALCRGKNCTSQLTVMN